LRKTDNFRGAEGQLELTIEEYRVCQYSARWDSNLVRYKPSSPEARPLATQDTNFDGPGIL